ncbi:YdcF family protein [Spartinivicinus poritis]|uniref:YdcF family protein n=1 Tax=Spartinivicinus poritis TaxID=2994640 RepID=A0ABT5UC45_9GAMM|nr:YdcF family protein [Spartinivicinus sp. A2-2]MDE1463077.1 YdcF family protein [Spartinivicinus sp. A2-2]
MQQYLISHGVPASAIFIEQHSFDTQTNWENAKKIIANQQWKKVQVISTALHLHRLKGIISHNHPSQTIITYSPIPQTQSDPNTSYFELWYNAHYDWAAYLSYLLPQTVYNWLIKAIRNQA